MDICPDCNGAGYRLRDGDETHWRCWTCVGNGILQPYPDSRREVPPLKFKEIPSCPSSN